MVGVPCTCDGCLSLFPSCRGLAVPAVPAPGLRHHLGGRVRLQHRHLDGDGRGRRVRHADHRAGGLDRHRRGAHLRPDGRAGTARRRPGRPLRPASLPHVDRAVPGRARGPAGGVGGDRPALDPAGRRDRAAGRRRRRRLHSGVAGDDARPRRRPGPARRHEPQRGPVQPRPRGRAGPRRAGHRRGRAGLGVLAEHRQLRGGAAGPRPDQRAAGAPQWRAARPRMGHGRRGRRRRSPRRRHPHGPAAAGRHHVPGVAVHRAGAGGRHQGVRRGGGRHCRAGHRPGNRRGLRSARRRAAGGQVRPAAAARGRPARGRPPGRRLRGRADLPPGGGGHRRACCAPASPAW